MKLNIQEDQSMGETEITIRCPYLNDRLKRLVEQIRQYGSCLTGYQENRQFQIPLESIYYLESTDGKTFLYQKKEVYICRESLTALEPQLARSGFVRISKNCILNLAFLEYVEPLFNHRLKAILKNGEALIISRNYIASLKEQLKGSAP